jgi:hypothetical protein
MVRVLDKPDLSLVKETSKPIKNQIYKVVLEKN